MEDTIQCGAVSIHAMHDALCLVGGDESIWGFGKRVQGFNSDQEELRKIEQPPECKNFMKVTHGKFCRLVLTRDNRLWFTGQARNYMIGSHVNRNDH